MIFDLLFFLDFIFRKLHKWDADNMLAQNLFYASYKMPTPWSRICFHLYSRTDFLARLKIYHTSSNGIKPLYELYVVAYDFLWRQHEDNTFDKFIMFIFRVRYEDISQELRQN